VKNGKVQVYCVLGSKVSSVVAEHLEHFVARPDPGASQADLCPSNRPLRPPHGPGFGLEAPSLIPICTQSRFKRVSAPDSLQTRREAEDADRATRDCLLSRALMI